MESQNFGHAHPLTFSEQQSNQSQEASCSRCGEVVSGLSFSCAECEFYLHKDCADAPSEIHHPLHRKHPLLLLPSPPKLKGYARGFLCDFCDKIGTMFLYHCSCGLDFHIKCALFSCNIAQKIFGKLEHLATPWISTDEQKAELESAKCFGCWNLLLESKYFSLDCGFNLHEKCAQLSPEINHFSHPQHPLILQFNGERFSCNMCQIPQRRGFVYCCSPCKFALHIKCAELPSEINHLSHRKHPLVLQSNSDSFSCKICLETNEQFVYCCSPCKFALHIECVSPLPTIKEKSHQHPFVLFWRPASFICDACGLEGNHVAYICSTCSIIVHVKCISLPGIIIAVLHHHPLLHTYFLHQHEFKSWDCRICHDSVNIEHGSYSCLDCKFIVHVNCIIKRKRWYHVVDPERKHEMPILLTDVSVDSITCVIERNEAGEATKIKHFIHDHDLVLSKMIIGDYRCCDGCMLPISTSFYSCSQCDFFLHKTCAEVPQKTRLWFHLCQGILPLIAYNVFTCDICEYLCSGFAYTCHGCQSFLCLRCSVPDSLLHDAHKHTLLFYYEYEGLCNACGNHLSLGYCCKRCNFALHVKCTALPQVVPHNCDEHLLTLTYYDNNDYSEYHYCDICEERRDPKLWFYYCKFCNTSVHPQCILGTYPFVKVGNIYQAGNHQHPLMFVKKIYHYLECHECGKPCQDLALECGEFGCNYIIHWKCKDLSLLLEE